MFKRLKLTFEIYRALKFCDKGYALIRKNQDGSFEIEELATEKFCRNIGKDTPDE